MNGDEITFGDVRLREPLRRRPPDHDRRLSCVSCDGPSADDLPIFLDHAAALAIERHAASDVSVELGGVLLGKECVDPVTERPYVVISDALEAAHYHNSQASFTYTHDSWEAITRDRDRLFPDCDVVGWYHTHPNFGIFLSGHDLFIHQHFFSQPLQVAYVVDPINQTRGFFQWKGGTVAAVGGFHLTGERSERQAVARAADQLERIPAREPGGALSPRLEGELIKMLTRMEPASRTIPRDLTTTAVVAGTAGAILGALLIGTVFQLVRLTERIPTQERNLAPLAATVADLADGQKLAMDALRDRIEESPESFTSRYAQAARDRDQALRRLERERAATDALFDKQKSLETQLASLTRDHGLALKKLDESATAVKEAAALKSRVKEAEQALADQKQKLDWLDTEPGKAAETVHHELVLARYAAYAGWAAVVLLALAMVGLFFRGRPDEQDEPTHRHSS